MICTAARPGDVFTILLYGDTRPHLGPGARLVRKISVLTTTNPQVKTLKTRENP